jgi:hypothetical protein
METPAHEITRNALADVFLERVFQNGKWGEQHHKDVSHDSNRAAFAALAKTYQHINDTNLAHPDWSNILLEEVYEALAEQETASMRQELVQVAAVAVAWIEDLDSRTTT